MFLDIDSLIIIPKQYIVTKTIDKIIIDGKANEPGWESALYTSLFVDIEGDEIPKYDTKLKMLWDNNFLYVYAKLNEPHIWANLKKRDTVIYHNNDFEIFISPSGTTHNYGEIEINSLGTVWDLLLDKPYRNGGKSNNHWNLRNLKSDVYIQGSLNEPDDTDSFWSVEIAIPMKALIELKNHPRISVEEGEQWRINFSRVEWEFEIIDGKYSRKKDKHGKLFPEYNWVWSPQHVIDMHLPEHWGIIQFTNESVSTGVIFKKDKNMFVKQIAYELFRQTKFGKFKKLLLQSPGFVQNYNIVYSNKKSLSATFYKTNFGFEFKINNPHSNEIFIINEEGVLK